MKKIPSWREVGEQMVKGAAIALGQKLIAEKVAPAASSLAKKTWERVKNTKSLTKEEPPAQAAPAKKGYRQAKVTDVTGKSMIVDAEFTND